MNKNNILILALSDKRVTKFCIQKAIDIAKKENLIIKVYYFVSPEGKKKIIKNIGELAFLGVEEKERMKSILQKEDFSKGEMILKYARERAKEINIKIETVIEEGDFYDKVKEVNKTETPKKIVLTRMHPKWIGKKWFGSIVDRLIKEIECPIIVVKGKGDNIF